MNESMSQYVIKNICRALTALETVKSPMGFENSKLIGMAESYLKIALSVYSDAVVAVVRKELADESIRDSARGTDSSVDKGPSENWEDSGGM